MVPCLFQSSLHYSIVGTVSFRTVSFAWAKIYLLVLTSSIAIPPSSTEEPRIRKATVTAAVTRRDLENEQDKGKWLWYEFTPFEVGCDELGGETFLESCHTRLSPHGSLDTHLGTWQTIRER